MTKEQNRKTKKTACIVFFIILSASIIAEFFIDMHPAFEFAGQKFFHAWYGFSVCIIIILCAKILGIFIKRQEGYYKEKR